MPGTATSGAEGATVAVTSGDSAAGPTEGAKTAGIPLADFVMQLEDYAPTVSITLSVISLCGTAINCSRSFALGLLHL